MSFRIREATPADFARIVAIMNSQINEPITLDDYLRQDHARPKSDIFLRLVAELEPGEVAAFGVTAHESTSHPGEFFARVRVDAPFRSRGIGAAIYQQLEAFARSNGATAMASGVREQDTFAYEWAQRRGFATKYHLCESTLNLAEWDSAPFQEAVVKAKAEGFRFTTLAQETAGLEPEAMYRRYHAWFWPIVHDIPGNEERPPMPFDEWYGYVKDDPDWKPEHVLLAVDANGAWAGVAHLVRVASGALYNDFTGIARDYRGRGLTLPLKVEALNLARSLGAPYIRTNNLSVNPRILAVNKQLGYIPSPGHHLLRKKFD